MRKGIILGLLTVFILCLCVEDAEAQRRRKKRKKRKPARTENQVAFKDRLWYGGNVNLGLSGNAFNFGLSPMVGYKIAEPFSIGPRAKVDFFSAKVFHPGLFRDLNFNTVNWGAGVFSRFKFLEFFLLHAEYEFEDRGLYFVDGNGFPIPDPENGDRVLKTRDTRHNFYVGGGYNSGDLFGYEILILYNVNEPSTSNQLPWEIRVGFTYNF